MSASLNPSNGKTDDKLDQIQSLKNQISMFQEQNELLKMEQGKMAGNEENLLMQKSHKIIEENAITEIPVTDEQPKLLSTDVMIKQKDSKQLIIEDADILNNEIDEDPRDIYLKRAYEKIDRLESDIRRFQICSRIDGRYIQKLENDLALYRSPTDRIEQLQDQLENVEHQYANLLSQLRTSEIIQKDRNVAYDSMKTKFAQFYFKLTNEKQELAAKLEEKEKENQQLWQVIAHLQAPKTTMIPFGSQNTDTSSINSETTTNETTDLTKAVAFVTPQNYDVGEDQ